MQAAADRRALRTRLEIGAEGVRSGIGRKNEKSGNGNGEQAAAALVVKSPQQALTELAGSMIVAAAMGATMSIVVRVDARRNDRTRAVCLKTIAMVSVLGSWSILIASKFWEGIHGGEALLRHVAQLILGLGIGGIAYLAADALMLKFSATPMQSRALTSGDRRAVFRHRQRFAIAQCVSRLFRSRLFGLVNGWWRPWPTLAQDAAQHLEHGLVGAGRLDDYPRVAVPSTLGPHGGCHLVGISTVGQSLSCRRAIASQGQTS